MIHTVFWLTGAITWGLIALAGAMFLVADLHDRSVMRRDPQRLADGVAPHHYQCGLREMPLDDFRNGRW